MPKRVLVLASAGGHWQQLMLMRPAFAHHDVTYVTTLRDLPAQFDAHPSEIVTDCNRHEPRRIVTCSWQLLRLVLRLRPQVVLSTGALPGVIALSLGRLVGARTVWIDSVANAQEISMSGRYAKRVAHLCLSQWEHVAQDSGTEFAGSVL